MKGVFLHVLGDALGSVVVMVSATVYLVVPKICPATAAELASNITAVSENETMCPVEEVMPPIVNYVDPILR